MADAMLLIVMSVGDQPARAARLPLHEHEHEQQISTYVHCLRS